MFITKDWFDTHVCFSPEGAGGGAGAAGEGEGGADEKKFFTQEQVNAMMKDHKLGLRKEVDALKFTLAEKESYLDDLMGKHKELETSIEELKKLGIAPKGSGGEGDDKNKPLSDIIKEATTKIKTLEEGIGKIKKEYDGRLGELEGDLDKERSLRQIAEEEALVTERDSALQKALLNAGCREDAVDVAIKMFDDMVEIDTDTGQWFLVNDKTGEEWPLTEGVFKNLPAYMKRAMTDKKGAGSFGSTGVSDEAQVSGKIATIDAEIEKLQGDYAKSRDGGTLVKVQRLLREKKQLERQMRMAKV